MGKEVFNTMMKVVGVINLISVTCGAIGSIISLAILWDLYGDRVKEMFVDRLQGKKRKKETSGTYAWG